MLTVDDNEANLKLNNTLLSELVESIDSATNGAEALQKASQFHYDVIFMDINMPVMDGITACQRIQQSYQDEVITPLLAMFAPGGSAALQAQAECFTYGELDYRHLGFGRYPLYAVRTRNWHPARPFFLVTGGVHGYERSGVQGGLRFVAEQFVRYAERANLLFVVCVSPWSYETINRWNPAAVDPNRSFVAGGPSQEANAARDLLLSELPGAPLAGPDDDPPRQSQD